MAARKSQQPDAEEENGRRSSSDSTLLRGSNHHALSIDSALSLISHPERRQLLHVLQSRADRYVNIESIIDELLETDHGYGSDHHTQSVDEAIFISLYHQHIPKLVSAGVVKYQEDKNKIRYEGDPVLDIMLTVIGDIEA